MDRQERHTIGYTWIDETSTQRWGDWYGARADAIAAAAEALDADDYGDGRYVYRDDAEDGIYCVTGDALASLGAALLAGHTLGETYSIWCASEEAEEIPQCEGGAISGVRCQQPATCRAVLVPPARRDSAIAAGVTCAHERADGWVEELQLCADCAEHYAATEGDWLRILDEPATT